MELMDYHSHHYRCGHAKGSIEDYIKVAIEKGLLEIGIADHFPYGPTTDIPNFEERPRAKRGMTVAEFPEYVQEIKDLRDRYEGVIKVKVSTEVAFVTAGSHLDRQKEVLDPLMDDFDYLLCGLHFIRIDGAIISLHVDSAPEALQTHGEDRIHGAYLEKLSRMVETGYFDIVTHLDNHKLLWLPDEPVYSNANWRKMMDVLDLIKSKGMAVEINTHAARKGCLSQFPSDGIVKEMIRRDIPLVLSSDAHQPKEIGYGFLEFIERAKQWGLTHLCSYEKREQRLVPIE